jgi:hypothetical protein
MPSVSPDTAEDDQLQHARNSTNTETNLQKNLAAMNERLCKRAQFIALQNEELLSKLLSAKAELATMRQVLTRMESNLSEKHSTGNTNNAAKDSAPSFLPSGHIHFHPAHQSPDKWRSSSQSVAQACTSQKEEIETNFCSNSNTESQVELPLLPSDRKEQGPHKFSPLSPTKILPNDKLSPADETCSSEYEDDLTPDAETDDSLSSVDEQYIHLAKGRGKLSSQP